MTRIVEVKEVSTPRWRRQMEKLAREQDELETRRPGGPHAALARMIRAAAARSVRQMSLPMTEGGEANGQG